MDSPHVPVLFLFLSKLTLFGSCSCSNASLQVSTGGCLQKALDELLKMPERLKKIQEVIRLSSVGSQILFSHFIHSTLSAGY